MNKNTFGDSKKYAMLEHLTEMIDALPTNKKAYISKFINVYIKKVNTLKQGNLGEYETYFLFLLFEDHLFAINNFLSENYDEKLLDYLKNYFSALIKS